MKTHYDPAKFRLLEQSTPGPTGGWVERPIHVPIAVVRGLLEKLTPDELRRLRDDINAEYERREHNV